MKSSMLFGSFTALLGFAASALAQQVVINQGYTPQVYSGQTVIQQGTVIQGGTPIYGTPQYGVPQGSPQYYNSVPQVYPVSPQAGLVQPGDLNSANVHWSQKLTDQRSHDFGTVALASKQEHTFEFLNNTGADLNLISVRASCGCTKPRILTSLVKPGETARVLAKYDTKAFYGKKGATVTLGMQKIGTYAEYAELQFTVAGFIRRDVVMNPGEIQFGDVDQSKSANRTATLLYAGDPNWQITDVRTTNPNIKAVLKETQRDPNQRRVAYELQIELDKNQKPGSFSDELTIITNDSKTTGMSMSVVGNVKQAIQISPIRLGVINKGQKIRKRLVVHSENAVEIKEIRFADPRIRFEEVKGQKSLHIINYEVDTTQVGEIDEVVQVVTKGQGESVTDVPFNVQIVPATIVENVK